MKGRVRRKDWYLVGFRIQEEVGHRKADLHLAQAPISSQWEGLHASEALDSAMLGSLTLLRADGQNVG